MIDKLKPMDVVLLLLAFGALAFCVLAFLEVRSSGNEVLGADSERIQPYLAVLESQVGELRKRQEELQDLLNRPSLANSTEPLAEPNRESAELEAQITDLRDRLDRLLSVPADSVVDGDAGESGEEAASAYYLTALADFRVRAIDVLRAPQDRVAALEVLRRYSGGIDGSVAGSMLALLSDPDSEAPLRTRILRNLHGVADPRCRDAFLSILERDPDEKVRAEAAECLGEFASEASVGSALSWASDNDSSAEVRGEAAAALQPASGG